MSPSDPIEADVVIVGSGVAGAVAACRLAKKGVRNIVILEAGPRIDRAQAVRGFAQATVSDPCAGFPDPAWAPRPDWTRDAAASYIERSGPQALDFFYLRAVGGTTWHWGGVTPRPVPADFGIKSAYGVGADWPVTYDMLEPFYAEAEEEIGVAGAADSHDGGARSKPYPLPPIPLSYCDKALAEEMRRIGLPLSHRPVARASLPYRGRGQCVGFGTCSPICPSGAQYGAIYHVEEAERLGVRVLENTRVDRIVADGAVTALEARRPDGTAVTARAKVFVLAANAIETPRLLLMSAGENRPAGIANSSGLVGRNHMDHPALSCSLSMPSPVWAGRGPVSTTACTAGRDGAFRKHRPASILSVENGVHIMHIAGELLRGNVAPPALDPAIRDRAARSVLISIGIEQLPDAQNGITLRWDRRDSTGQPVMRHYYSLGAYEQAGLEHAKETFARIAKALKAEITAISGPGTQNHLMGMTRMGDDPRRSVTDSYGRCHDHKNLFIASSSLFPSAGTANPTLTIAALSLRMADEIARQLAG